jgi:hypothetical protein
MVSFPDLQKSNFRLAKRTEQQEMKSPSFSPVSFAIEKCEPFIELCLHEKLIVRLVLVKEPEIPGEMNPPGTIQPASFDRVHSTATTKHSHGEQVAMV